jgi:diacylglycerol kinase family enzyme
VGGRLPTRDRAQAGVAGAALLITGAIALEVVEERLLEDVLLAVGVGGALAATKMAFNVSVKWPPAERPTHAVLLYNPLSGAGKAVRLHLPDEARSRGIEPIEVRPKDDLAEVVHGAVARGADAIAMAGGDGSQAAVAAATSELGVPYACIPAGTHNHFALDLGVDRGDVIGALDAFVDGGERRVDLAEVNGRAFVNSVSLGLYASAVRRPEYHQTKLQTLLDTVPDMVGPGAKPPNLLWSGASEEQPVVAMVVSNNPYRLGHALGSGTRPQLDSGMLGVSVLQPIRAGANGVVTRKLAVRQWTTRVFAIDAETPLAAGIDGEAAELDPPLRFRVLPAALRVRVAHHHPGASPSAHRPETPWKMIHALVTVAVHGRLSGLPQVPSPNSSRR